MKGVIIPSMSVPVVYGGNTYDGMIAVSDVSNTGNEGYGRINREWVLTMAKDVINPNENEAIKVDGVDYNVKSVFTNRTHSIIRLTL